MAKGKNKDLFNSLRASGLRKRVAAPVTEAVRGGARKGRDQKVIREVIENLRKTATELEDRATGGPGKRKAAAKKGAATRKRNAAKRSASAKKGAATRKRNA
jgi:hypothetical protein